MYSDIIRETIYGKDMRKPIADSCEAIRKKYQDQGIIVKRLDDVDTQQISGEEDSYRLIFRV